MILIGIDPDLSGGIVWLDDDPDAGINAEVFKMPATVGDAVELLQDISDIPGPSPPEVRVIIENVHAFPGTKKPLSCPRCKATLFVTQSQGIASTAKFMKNAGHLEGIVATLGVRYEFASPPTWQRALGVRAIKGETKTDHKNRLKAKCQQLFPQIKITHAISDALLLCEFGRLKYGRF